MPVSVLIVTLFALTLAAAVLYARDLQARAAAAAALAAQQEQDDTREQQRKQSVRNEWSRIYRAR